MTDPTGENKPFPGFPGFASGEMFEKMWEMMRLTPFGAAFSGMQPGAAQGVGSPLSTMSDMMAPLLSVEELDKRITDMRAVEQWLKLNLSMLQSAIQGLEVQRATLSTLRAFGAFAQASMAQPAKGTASGGSAPAAAPWASKAAAEPAPGRAEAAGGASKEQQAGAAPQAAPFDASAWWNLLQSQFNQLAAFAMAQPGAAGTPGASTDTNEATPGGGTETGSDSSETGSAGAPGQTGAKRAANPAKPATKRPGAQKASGKPPGSTPTQR
jgi:hypothetical protein